MCLKFYSGFHKIYQLYLLLALIIQISVYSFEDCELSHLNNLMSTTENINKKGRWETVIRNDPWIG